MRICLLGEFFGDLDEGMRKSSLYFSKELVNQGHEVLTIDIRNIYSLSSWSRIRAFKPEIIHYLHGPTFNSLLVLRIISLFSLQAKTVAYSMRPRFSRFTEKFIPFVKPDLILTQSLQSEAMFNRRGCKTQFLPIGVDLDKYKPAVNGERVELREKYGLDKNKFLVMHVGSIKEGRNVQIFKQLQNTENQVILIGAVSPGIDQNLAQELEKCGCIVWTKFFPNIEEVYKAVDCYVFPVIYRSDASGKAQADSIEFPLSVLEAMACNLPVLTTQFGGLPSAFQSGDGLIYVEEQGNDFADGIGLLKKSVNINTRSKVNAFSWESITKRLVSCYTELVKN